MNTIWIFIKKRGGILIKLIFLFLIGLLYLSRAFNEITPYPTGDGPEYILTTEAFYNHFTPDVRYEDAISFKKSYCQKEAWETNFKADFFDQVEDSLKTNSKEFLKGRAGFVTDKIGRHYGYHFFFYSILNVPGRFIAEKIHANPMRSFQVTNAFIVIITCFFLLFLSPFSFFQTILIALTFCFSSVYWYLGWTHTEVFMICVVTLGMWFFSQEKYYLGIFLVALGGLQYQPLLMILLFMAIMTLIKNGFSIRNILKIGLSSFIFLWPPLFYFFHFGTTNLIGNEDGFMSMDNITFTRVFGFYFDFNQGAILGIPLVLILYLFYCLRKWVLMARRKEAFDFTYFLVVFLLIMTCIVSAISLLNPVGAIINRYAAWFSAIIIVHLFFIIKQFKIWITITLLSLILITQASTVLYWEKFNKFDWNFAENNVLASWFLDEHPELYNPDPQIFIARTNGFDFSPDASPVIYIKNCEEVTKMAVHKDNLNNLIEYGFTKGQIDSIKINSYFLHGWAYLNRGDLKISKTGQEIYQILREKKIFGFEQLIRDSKSWFKQIEEKAKVWNKSVDEVIKVDAEWLMEEREKAEQIKRGSFKEGGGKPAKKTVVNSETARQETILDFEKQMRGNPTWYKQIEAKAKAMNKTVDEVIKADSEWLMKEREKAEQFKNGNFKEGDFNTTNKTTANRKETREETILGFEKQMRESPIWLKQIQAKAKAMNKPVDEVIKSDAEWLMRERERAEKGKPSH